MTHPAARDLKPVPFRWAFVAPVLASAAVLVAVALLLLPAAAGRAAGHPLRRWTGNANGWMDRNGFMVSFLVLAGLFTLMDLAVVFWTTKEPLIAVDRLGERWWMGPERGLPSWPAIFTFMNLFFCVLLWDTAVFNLQGAHLIPMNMLIWTIVPILVVVVAGFFLLAQRKDLQHEPLACGDAGHTRGRGWRDGGDSGQAWDSPGIWVSAFGIVWLMEGWLWTQGGLTNPLAQFVLMAVMIVPAAQRLGRAHVHHPRGLRRCRPADRPQALLPVGVAALPSCSSPWPGCSRCSSVRPGSTRPCPSCWLSIKAQAPGIEIPPRGDAVPHDVDPGPHHQHRCSPPSSPSVRSSAGAAT